MSIEKDFGRIASALERIATVMEGKTSLPVVAAAAPVPAPSATAAPTPPAPAPSATAVPTPPAPTALGPVAAAPTPPAPAAPAAAMTMAQLNDILVAEFTRLGNNREPIDKILREQFGVVGVSALPAEKYADLVAAVRAVAV